MSYHATPCADTGTAPQPEVPMSAIAELPSHVKLGERQVHLNLS